MNNPHFYLGTRKKETTLYLFYNAGINAYKFGITSKPLNERISNYCNDKSKFYFTEYNTKTNEFKEYNYPFAESDIKILFCKELNNVDIIEKELMKMINGCRLKLKGQQYPFREHFIGKDKADSLLSFLNGY